MSDIKKYVAEMIGSMVLVLLGVGSLVAVVASGGGSTLVGVGLAFAIAVIAMVYAIGPISGCHINPAVTIGLLCIKAINVKDAVMYVIFQIIGAVIASVLLYLFFSNMGDYDVGAIFQGASNAYSTTDGVGYGLVAVFILEFFLAFILQFVILGSLNNKGWSVNAGIAIGLTVAALIYLAGPIDGAGINPIRALGSALFADGKALEQLWLFFVAPIIGGIVGSFTWKWLGKEDAAKA
jgi:aquaporin Z